MICDAIAGGLRHFSATWQAGAHPRDPVVASWFGAPDASGENVTETTAMQIAAVYCAVNLISNSIGSLPLIVNRRTGERSKERFRDHPLYRMLHDEPNEEMTTPVFVRTLQAHALMWGNGYAEIERARSGRPRALWPLTPDIVTPRRNGRQLVYEVRRANAAPIVLDSYNVLHVPGLGFDGCKGYSVVGMVRLSLGLATASEKFGAAFFGNGAVPGGVLKHPGKLGLEAAKRVKESWQARHQGAGSAHRTAVLEEGMSYERIGIPPEDAQFLETRQFSVVEIARWFNVPPHKLKDLSRATFSNIEHQSIEYLTDTLLPWIVVWEKELDRKLLTETERSTVFSSFVVDGVLRADIKTRYDAYAIGTNNGWLSPDDVREKEDMNPLPYGQGGVYMRPLNMVSAGKVAADAAKSADVADGEKDQEFKRDVVKAFLNDRTTNDVLYNLTRIETLMDQVGIPREADVKAPFLPVVAESGPLVSGETIEDQEGDVVGGDVLESAAVEPLAEPEPTSTEADPEQGDEPVKQDEKSTDDQADQAATVRRLRACMRPAFADAFDRMRRVEDNARKRNMGKPDDAVRLRWRKFVDGHAENVRGALIAPVEALAESMRQFGVAQPDEQRTAEATASVVQTYIAHVGESSVLTVDWPDVCMTTILEVAGVPDDALP